MQDKKYLIILYKFRCLPHYVNGLIMRSCLKPLTAKPTKWSNKLKKIRRQQPTNCLSVFDHTVGLAFNPLSANPTKWSNTLKQFVGCLSVFDHFVKLVLKGLRVNV